MNKAPTPRTDEFFSSWDYYNDPFDAINHAEILERELTAAREELAEWRILNSWGGTPEIINDFIKGQQTRIYYERNLEEELTAVTEQRDGLHELHNKNAARSKELLELCMTLRKEKDRLAEALRKIKNEGGRFNDPYDELDFIDGITYEALQSLNQSPNNA